MCFLVLFRNKFFGSVYSWVSRLSLSLANRVSQSVYSDEKMKKIVGLIRTVLLLLLVIDVVECCSFRGLTHSL